MGMPGYRLGAVVFSAFVAFAPAPRAATPAIAAGDGATILKADGTVLVTGSAAHFPLEPGRFQSTSPFAIPGLGNVVAIAASSSSRHFLMADGTVWGFGYNGGGVLGNGTTTGGQSLTQAVGLSQIVQIHCSGGGHCLALRSDGAVWAWGVNSSGQIGDGTTVDRPLPVQVMSPGNIRSVRASPFASFALGADGTVWAWGGLNGGIDIRGTRPERILGPRDVQSIAASEHAFLHLRTDGTVWATGYNAEGALGNHSEMNTSTFVQVHDISDIVAIAANGTTHLALKRDGTVWAWGSNARGAMGSGDFGRAIFDAPSRVVGLANIVAIDAGRHSAYALASDGSVYAWGANDVGQLGDNTITDRAAPVRMVGPGGTGSINVLAAQAAANRLPTVRLAANPSSGTTPLSVSADASQSSDADGSIARYDWRVSDGRVASGPTAQFVFAQPGSFQVDVLVTDNSGGSAFASQQIVVSSANTGVQGRLAIVAGHSTIAALGPDGKAFSWGFATLTGRAENGRDTVPVAIANIAGIRSISLGGSLGLAALADGSVSAWGINASGELGDGSTVRRQTPVPVQGISNVIAVAAGENHALALKEDGTVWSWGTNRRGELGIGVTVDRKTPGIVIGLSNVKAIAAGAHFSIALKSDETVWGWGLNDQGQLGDPRPIDRLLPEPIPVLSRIKKIWCGQQHCFAADADGNVWGWGDNFSGELGLGHNVTQPGPVMVPALRGFVELAAGAHYSVGVHPDGTVWTWGQVLGPAVNTADAPKSEVPVQVPGISKAIAVAATTFGGAAVAVNADGTVLAWGLNRFGEVGDGTLVPRTSVVSAINESLDGLFDLLPDVPNDPSLSKSIAIFTRASASGALTDPTLTVNNFLRFNAADVGKTESVYVFAMAPANLVRNAAASTQKDDVQCVLAQLNASGQLQAVSAANLQAYVTGVLSGQGTAVTVLNGVATANIAGATFFVGYGPNSTAMIDNGTNRGTVAIPGARACVPQPPQKGWWWNPIEGGRGYSIEMSGNKIFFAAYLYDSSGRATWTIAAGNTSLDGSLFQGRLESYAGGQSLAGSYRAPGPVNYLGDVTLAFTDASHGTMIWPGGTVAIERFNIIPNGLTTAAPSGQPESGWWWSPNESGRGYFLEWQGNTLFMAGYMYDDAGNPIWYLSSNPSSNVQNYSNTWWQYANGQTLTGAYRPAQQVNNNVGPVTIQFQGAETGIMTLPGSRSIPIRRYRF